MIAARQHAATAPPRGAPRPYDGTTVLALPSCRRLAPVLRDVAGGVAVVRLAHGPDTRQQTGRAIDLKFDGRHLDSVRDRLASMVRGLGLSDAEDAGALDHLRAICEHRDVLAQIKTIPAGAGELQRLRALHMNQHGALGERLKQMVMSCLEGEMELARLVDAVDPCAQALDQQLDEIASVLVRSEAEAIESACGWSAIRLRDAILQILARSDLGEKSCVWDPAATAWTVTVPIASIASLLGLPIRSSRRRVLERVARQLRLVQSIQDRLTIQGQLILRSAADITACGGAATEPPHPFHADAPLPAKPKIPIRAQGLVIRVLDIHSGTRVWGERLLVEPQRVSIQIPLSAAPLWFLRYTRAMIRGGLDHLPVQVDAQMARVLRVVDTYHGIGGAGGQRAWPLWQVLRDAGLLCEYLIADSNGPHRDNVTPPDAQLVEHAGLNPGAALPWRPAEDRRRWLIKFLRKLGDVATDRIGRGAWRAVTFTPDDQPLGLTPDKSGRSPLLEVINPQSSARRGRRIGADQLLRCNLGIEPAAPASEHGRVNSAAPSVK